MSIYGKLKTRPTQNSNDSLLQNLAISSLLLYKSETIQTDLNWIFQNWDDEREQMNEIHPLLKYAICAKVQNGNETVFSNTWDRYKKSISQGRKF